jgi:hypothetical protein
VFKYLHKEREREREREREILTSTIFIVFLVAPPDYLLNHILIASGYWTSVSVEP